MEQRLQLQKQELKVIKVIENIFGPVGGVISTSKDKYSQKHHNGSDSRHATSAKSRLLLYIKSYVVIDDKSKC